MSKTIKITNGEAQIKDIFTRKAKKEYNRVLSEDVKMKTDQSGKADVEGFSMEAVDKANDTLLVNMVEKLTINGEEKSVELKTFDEMTSADVDKILEEIDKVSAGEEDKKKE